MGHIRIYHRGFKYSLRDYLLSLQASLASGYGTYFTPSSAARNKIKIPDVCNILERNDNVRAVLKFLLTGEE